MPVGDGELSGEVGSIVAGGAAFAAWLSAGRGQEDSFAADLVSFGNAQRLTITGEAGT